MAADTNGGNLSEMASQRHTDERMSALILTVDEIFRNQKRG
jgi:hypothetical protein